MNKEITVYRFSDFHKIRVTVCTASSCPKCGVTLSSDLLYAFLVDDVKDECNNKIFILNLCPHCEECFLSRHLYDEDSDTYLHESSAPMHFFHVSFSENIKKLSPNFISIYNESAHAEALGLTSICGMGYRQALEFLAKDYCIFKYQENFDNISSTPLSKCIENYMKDTHISTLARASAWLGNDETHYTKKHNNYGLPELKAFITALVTYIDAELAFEDANLLLSS